MAEPDKQIAVAVVVQAGHVLVGRRTAGQVLAGMDEFPGGKVEPDELPERAVVRECREETGLTVRVVELLEQVSHTYEHGRLLLSFYRCACADEPDAGLGPTLPKAEPPFVWVPVEELPRLNFPAANVAVLERLRTQR